eukprot:c47587_g1_i1 orf=530-1915(-)
MIVKAIFICLLLISLTCCFSKLQAVEVGIDYEEPQSYMSPAEMEALFEVMEGFTGNRNWRTLHPQPCTDDVWPGLVCTQGEDGLLHITRLDFGYKPNPLCTANATISPSIVKLTSLQSLFIFYCFTSMNTTIPPGIKQLAPSLEELSLRGNNALVGKIPPELGNLGALQVLSLSQNRLEGSIPSELGKLTNLQNLDLSYNRIIGKLPDELENLINIRILDLSVNSLSGTIPPFLGRLSRLRKLDLSFNLLKSSLPQEIGGLNGLQFLSMGNNLISGPFPGTFSSLRELQYLNMANNPMNSPLPIFLGGFPNMLTLTLSNSGFFGSIPEDVGLLTNLTVLSLDRNNLTGKIPWTLGELPNIYELNLSRNTLSGPIPFSKAFVHRLGRNLDLHGNPGLCSQWPFTENTTVEILQTCTDQSDSIDAISAGSSSLYPSTEKSALTYFRLASMACLHLLVSAALQC